MSFRENIPLTWVLIIQHVLSIVGYMHDWVPREKADTGKLFNSVYIQGICYAVVKTEF